MYLAIAMTEQIVLGQLQVNGYLSRLWLYDFLHYFQALDLNIEVLILCFSSNYLPLGQVY